MVQHIVTGESTSDGEVYLVTGSHGHIGSYIVEELCRQKDNIEIVCLDNFYNANIDNLLLEGGVISSNWDSEKSVVINLLHSADPNWFG